MLVFCQHKNPRIEYAVNTFLKCTGFDEVKITTDESEFISSNDQKINYSDKLFEGVLQIVPHSLLNETGIKEQNPKMEVWKSSFCFFKTSDSSFSFDIFAASFFLLSRYEEYLPFIPDNHSRYSGKNSFLYNNKLLLRPLIDEWAQILRSEFNFPDKADNIKKTLTIDVDNAFAFLHKGFVRSTGGTVMNILKTDFHQVGDRMKVLKGKMNDPFDTYDYILETAQKNKVDLKFFFLLGDRAKNDTNLSHLTPQLREKIKSIAENAECGIHPSYQSFLKKEKVQEEIHRLENITGKKVRISRQHFLRMKLPQSYQILLNCGITEDHTMGFADEPGYRAGTSKLFFWYDLSREQQTDLKIYPFVMMDATLRRYLSLSPEKAIEYSKEVFENAKKCGGDFTLLWHNESVNDYWKWKDWQKVFESQLALS